ncbi:MAG: response regulator [Desulfamplus sp.]|nr:response regulator [Desulfamplus sp.]
MVLPNSPALELNSVILIVEDEPAILKLVKLMIEKEGYHIITAASPSDAVNIAKNHKGKIDGSA